MQSVPLPVHTEYSLDPTIEHLDTGVFPFITGDFREVDGHYGFIPSEKPTDIVLHKPAQQHHRSAQIFLPQADGLEPLKTTDEKSRYVTAKGVNMSRPKIGVVTNGEGRNFPYTYGLMSQAEMGEQPRRAKMLKEAGVGTELFLGSFVVDSYLVDGHRLDSEEYWHQALGEFTQKLTSLDMSLTNRIAKENAVLEYANHPHIVLLRATESVLRVADLQDAPTLYKEQLLTELTNLNVHTPQEYSEWLQERAAKNVSGLHELGFVHRALYHGGNITAYGEIVDLDTLREPGDYDSVADYDEAAAQDVSDVASNILQLQKAWGLPGDASVFLSKTAT